MKTIIKKHKDKIIIGCTIAIILLAALSTPKSENGKNVVIYMDPWDGNQIAVGQITKIDVNVNADIPINAAGATISFPKNKIEIIGLSKERSFFDLWTEETLIAEEKGEISFSGGTFKKGGITGAHTILTLTIRAKRVGEANFIFKKAQVLAADGQGTDVLTAAKPLTYTIQEKETAKKLPASPDLNKDGKIDIADVTIMSVAIFKKYNPEYDLNGDGRVNLSDLSILLQMVF